MSGRRVALIALLAFALGAGALAVGQRFKEHSARVARMADAPPLDKAGYERRQSQFSLLQAGATIVFLGDSRVQEAEWSELLGRSDIANRGISGDTTSGVRARLSASVPLRTSICVIQVGFNDLLQGSAPDRVEQNFRAILQQLNAREKPCRVLLTSIIPGSDATGALNTRIAEVNGRLQRLATEEHADWVDWNVALTRDGALETQWTNDRAHLNGTAYQKIAAVLKQRLDELARLPEL